VNRYRLGLFNVVGVALLFAATSPDIRAGGRGLDSKVKASATATKPDADAKQIVTITLEIDKGVYLYANPVRHEFLEGYELKVKATAKENVKLAVKYPEGKTRAVVRESFDIYEGIVKIEAQVIRTIGDESPLTVHVAIRGSNGYI